MAFWLPVGLVVVILAAFNLLARRRQRKLLERLRAEWGRPAERARDFSEISHYHRVFAVDRESPLDARTGEDLNLDAVFAVLDRTESGIGQQLLYHRLRTTPTSDDLAAFEALMTQLSEDAAARERIQASLSRLRGHPGQVWWLTQTGILQTRCGDVMFPVLGLVVPVALMLTVVWPTALVAVILGVVANMIVRYVTALRLGPPLGPFRQVAPLLAVAELVRPLIAAHGLPVGSGLSSDLARMRRLQRIARWVGHDPMASDDLTDAIHETANMLFLLDLCLLVFASREIRAHGPALLRTVASVGTVDAAISVASYRVGATGWTRPVFESQSGTSRMLGLRHPLLPVAVPNSVEAPPRGILITGSNMSGKSTFLRTVGVNAILAQTINTCLTTSYRAPVFIVRSLIGRSDDLTAGRSYYRDEVEAVLSLVRASQSRRPHLFLFDELFRGTSTIERIAAAEATLAELIPGDTRIPSPHIVIAATHDRELVALLERTYASYHFTDSLDADGLSFDYVLRRGLARSWNAIALLESCGAPSRLVERALTRTAGLAEQRRPGGTGPAATNLARSEKLPRGPRLRHARTLVRDPPL